MRKQRNFEVTFGVIVANRGFFPDRLVEEGRKQILDRLDDLGYEYVVLSEEETEYGAVETREDAKKCARLFERNEDQIDGIIVTLPNFGDEKAIGDTIRESGLDVPVLVHAFPDELGQMNIENRRDSFCGKMSACNNLTQYGIPFTTTDRHVLDVNSESFKEEVDEFAGVCRIVNGVRGARLGSIGARTAPFNTVRYSEKILERNEVSVETIDLSEVLGQTKALAESSSEVKTSLQEIKEYVQTDQVPRDSLVKIAKLKWVLDRWVDENDLDATAIQCWSALEEYYGVVPCTAMSMMSEDLFPSACEVDVMGALGMYILELASKEPAALTDFNNNYGEELDKLVTFHCSNFPASFFEEPEMNYQDILANDLGKNSCYGTMVGRIASGPATFFRLSTADTEGQIRSYLAEGEYTDDELDTFGGYGVARIDNLQELMQYVTDNGFEHHVAVTKDTVGGSIAEALSKYLEWNIYFHTDQ